MNKAKITKIKEMNTVKVNIPKSINFEALFGDLPKSQQHHIKFLIHQINHFTIKEGSLGLHHKAYWQCLGLTSVELSNLISRLVEGNIIEVLSKGSFIAGKVSKYKMIETYKIADSITITYNVDQKGTPLFINKFFADNFHVRPKAESVYVRPVKSVPVNKVKNNINQDFEQMKKELENTLRLQEEALAKNAEAMERMQSLINVQAEEIATYQAELASLRASNVKDDNDVEDTKIEPKKRYTPPAKVKSDNPVTSDILDVDSQEGFNVEELEQLFQKMDKKEVVANDEIKTYQYGAELFHVSNWNTLLIHCGYDSDELMEELYDAPTNVEFDLSGQTIMKKYNDTFTSVYVSLIQQY